MRRRLIAAVVLAAGVVLAASALPSGGATDEQLNELVDGPFRGSGTVNGGEGPDCTGVSNGMPTVQDYVYGDGEPPAQAGTFHVEGCVEVLSTPFPVTGTFELVSGNGSTLAGDFDGTTTGDTFETTYTVTSGTGDFAGATGTIAAAGTADTNAPTVANVEGTFVGSLVAPPAAVPATTVPPAAPAVAVAEEPDFTG